MTVREVSVLILRTVKNRFVQERTVILSPFSGIQLNAAWKHFVNL